MKLSFTGRAGIRRNNNNYDSLVDVGYFALALCIIKGLDANDSMRYMRCLPKQGNLESFPIEDVDLRPAMKKQRVKGDRTLEVYRYLRENPTKGIRGCARAIGMSSSTIMQLIHKRRKLIVLPLFLTETETKILEYLQKYPDKKIEVVAFELGVPRKLVSRLLYENLL